MGLLTKLKTSLYRFYYKKISSTQWKVKRFFEAEFLLCPKNYIDRRIWVEGAYEKEQIAHLLEAAQKHTFDKFLDIGANFGLYSMIIAKQTNIPEVHSFECDPRNIAHFYGHMAMNDLTKLIALHQHAVGYKETTISFQMASEGNTGHSHIAKDAENYEIIHSEQDRLDSNLIEVQLRPIDGIFSAKNEMILMKIDVEGFEWNVLEGMRQTLSENKCLLQIEIIQGDILISKFLEDLGYKVTNQIGADFYYTNI